MLKRAIPVLRVADAGAAEDHYCRLLGFRRAFAYPAEGPGPRYLGLERDGLALHLSSFAGDGAFGSVVFLVVDDLDGLHAEFMARGVPVALAPTEQTWGNREMYVKDADGNCLRFVAER